MGGGLSGMGCGLWVVYGVVYGWSMGGLWVVVYGWSMGDSGLWMVVVYGRWVVYGWWSMVVDDGLWVFDGLWVGLWWSMNGLWVVYVVYGGLWMVHGRL